MKNILVIITTVILFTVSCTEGPSVDTVEVVLKNSTELTRTDQYLEIDLEDLELNEDLKEQSFIITEGENIIPSQRVNNNKLGIVLNFEPMEEKIITIKSMEEEYSGSYPKRTYAEVAMQVGAELTDGKYLGGKFQTFDRLRVPDGHTDHNALFKYEGPGWESDKIGYRMYIDWRNRIDIFGKKTNELVLKDVGINDLDAEDDSYHYMQDWGKDIFKVGSSFGIGSFGMMNEDEIVMVSERDSLFVTIDQNGPLKSEVKVDYFGWRVGEKKYDLTAAISITAGSRLSKVNLDAANDPDNFLTGLAKHPGTEFTTMINEGEWSYISLYGVQTAADYGQGDEPMDKLGIAVIFNEKDLIEQFETDDSYVVKLAPSHGKVSYYFGAAWEQEPNGITNENDFETYLNNTVTQLNNPISIEE